MQSLQQWRPEASMLAACASLQRGRRWCVCSVYLVSEARHVRVLGATYLPTWLAGQACASSGKSRQQTALSTSFVLRCQRKLHAQRKLNAQTASSCSPAAHVQCTHHPRAGANALRSSANALQLQHAA